MANCTLHRKHVLLMTTAPTRNALMWPTFILLMIGCFIFTDILLYFFIPPRYTRFAPLYRAPSGYKQTLGREYPRYYSHADPILGFDIAPLTSGVHIIRDGLEYEVFANDLGCFDRHTRKDFTNSSTDYAYFAGDSFTWGYTRYENKFATVWENQTGILAAKCGVGHTGTRHQFEKFKRTTTAIGRPPKVVFVGFFPNDIANDFTFPHTTVIEGFQVDIVYGTGTNQIVRRPYEDLVASVARQIKRFDDYKSQEASQGLWTKIKIWLKTHSLLTNIVKALWETVRAGKIFSGDSDVEESRSTPQLRSLYRLFDDADIRTEFAMSSLAGPTKEAITKWKNDAKSQKYDLVFLLIPPANDFNKVDFFDQVKEFLRGEKIEFVDLAVLFNEKGWSRKDLYWEIDGHLNEEGNRLVGLELSRLKH